MAILTVCIDKLLQMLFGYNIVFFVQFRKRGIVTFWLFCNKNSCVYNLRIRIFYYSDVISKHVKDTRPEFMNN